ncbi:OmpH family outer membrane protein [Alphaproteobacteria bacterium]|nr:OmpH family outer membrane protein [Alphaproteobacteria bacterium]
MKNFILLNVFIFIIFFNKVNAEQKIAFLNMDQIISKSNAGLSILKQLNKLNDKNLSSLNKIEKNIKEKETKLISQKNIFSESEFVNKVELLKKEINEHNQNRNKLISKFNKLKIENTNKLLKLINPILVKYSNDNEISFILQKKNLIIGKTEFDISDDILKIINNDIKEFNIN